VPANLTPDYKAAEERYKAATNDDERLAALIEMLSVMPKHKGTEKIQADVKTRISKLKKQQSGAKTGGAHRSSWYQVERQGAGQVTLFGSPNSGKSSIVATLTGAHTTVAPYPFATTAPQAGMMPYEDIKIQLIDTPPIHEDTEPWVHHFLRVADLLLMVLDLGDDDIIVNTEKLLACLAAKQIRLKPEGEYAARPVIVVGCKSDCEGAADRQAIAAEIIAPALPPAPPPTPHSSLPLAPDSLSSSAPEPLNSSALEPLSPSLILPVSTVNHTGLEELRLAVFQRLHVIRVYTKRPGHPVEMRDPVILPEGSTVIEAAQHLHKDFATQLKFAKLWDGDKINGLMVERTHVLADRSVVEFHL
jgi:uncharacterized protein